jgi:hypothetical protein
MYVGKAKSEANLGYDNVIAPAGLSALLQRMLIRQLVFILLINGLVLTRTSAQEFRAGPLYDHFELTLSPGDRTEAVGPLFYDELKETRRTWAIAPLFSRSADPGTDSEEYDFLYPLLSYDRFGEQYRWHFFQLISFAGGPTQTESYRRRFTLFPLYFQQRSSDPSENYTALLPIYGHLKSRLMRDEIYFILFPIYAQTRKKDVVTYNYLYPFFHLRHGDGLKGWQFWPLFGEEHKMITLRTNGFNDVETIPGHDGRFVLWPFFMQQKTGIGTTNEAWQLTSIPLFNIQRSAQRDLTTIIWPFFTYIDDREKKYHEWEGPWPFVVYARGEGKSTTRLFPLFSRSHSPVLESDFYLWPVYKYNRARAAPLDRERTRIMFFLYSDTIQRNTETGQYQRLVDFWPLFTHRHEYDGSTRLQVLALLEPYLPNNKSIERNYSQLWSIWRSEKSPRTGAGSQSLLWNLYRHDVKPASRKCSLFFGLFQYQHDAEGKHVRLFYVPLSGKGKSRQTSAQAEANS